MATFFLTASTTQSRVVGGGDSLVVLDGVAVTTDFSTYAVTLNDALTPTGLVNHGDIYAGQFAVRILGNDAQITNTGAIWSYEDAFKVEADAGTTDISIVNHGQIGTVSPFGVILDIDGQAGSVNYSIVNTGLISTQPSVEIVDSSTQLGNSDIFNSGTIIGGNIDMSGDGFSRLTNSGVIQTRFINMDADRGATFINHGQLIDTGGADGDRILSTSVTFSARDVVINHGEITGGIGLNGGGDWFENVGEGALNGTVNGGTGDDTLVGGSASDSFLGGDDADVLVGRGGDDLLNGGQGTDTVMGGAGDDDIFGESGSDALIGGSGNDTIVGGSGNDVLVGQDGSDYLDGGNDNDTMDGGAGDDVLEGGLGNDVLRGRSGEDELGGGTGLDFLTGGAGADLFLFRSTAEAGLGAARDQILDFEQGVDLISVVSMSAGVFSFVGTGAFTGANQVRVIETASGSSIVQFNTDADLAAEAEIRVAGVVGLTADDFAL
jgi:serralysin